MRCVRSWRPVHGRRPGWRRITACRRPRSTSRYPGSTRLRLRRRLWPQRGPGCCAWRRLRRVRVTMSCWRHCRRSAILTGPACASGRWIGRRRSSRRYHLWLVSDLSGRSPGTRSPTVFAAADLLVLPSRAEPYGMVVTEALACGVPVLATAVDGLPEALGRTSDGDVPGLLVPPDDPGALAGALRQWLTEPALRDRVRSRRRAYGGPNCRAGPRRPANWRRCWRVSEFSVIEPRLCLCVRPGALSLLCRGWRCASRPTPPPGRRNWSTWSARRG